MRERCEPVSPRGPCANVLEVCFSCPLCSRIFVKDCPYDGPIPRHLDALLGVPCPGSWRPVEAFQEVPDHPHPLGWPFGIHRRPPTRLKGRTTPQTMDHGPKKGSG